MRITKRNYRGAAFVPGYTPKCADAETCELLVKVTERLAFFEDVWEEYRCRILPLPKEKMNQMMGVNIE